MRRPFLCILTLAACGSPTTPDGVPCPATLVVSSQDGSSFQGTYHRAAPCAATAYPLTGTVQRDAALTVQVAGGERGIQGFDDCHYVSGDDRWRGEADGDDLSLRIDVVLTCPQTGVQRTVATISARRLAGR